jgi:hypothetical protein
LEPLQQAVNLQYEYPEFASAVERHFAVKADELKAQLEQWSSADAKLKGTAANILKNLSILQQRQNQKAADEAALKALPETVELLDDDDDNDRKRPPVPHDVVDLLDDY